MGQKYSVTLQHKSTKKMKIAPVGFSWTTFFFGFLVPFFRGDIKNAVILFLLGFGSIGAFFYNRWYIRGLVKSGYRAKSSIGDIEYIETMLGFELPRIQRKPTQKANVRTTGKPKRTRPQNI